MPRLTDQEKTELIGVIAELRDNGATWADVEADERVPVSAGSALRYFKDAGEPKPGDPILLPGGVTADPKPAGPVVGVDVEADGFTPIDAERAHHEELGWCVVISEGPKSYTKPHHVVRCEKDGMTYRVPTDELQFVDVTAND